MNTQSLATATQISLGIEAFILEIPGGDGQLVEFQGWTKSPRMDRPQYVGLMLAGDGEGALARLQANVRAQAADIEAELAPPAPPALARKARAAKITRVCTCPLCQPAAHQYPVGVFRCTAGREWLAFDGHYIAGAATELAAKAALNDHRHEGLRRAA